MFDEVNHKLYPSEQSIANVILKALEKGVSEVAIEEGAFAANWAYIVDLLKMLPRGNFREKMIASASRIVKTAEEEEDAYMASLDKKLLYAAELELAELMADFSLHYEDWKESIGLAESRAVRKSFAKLVRESLSGGTADLERKYDVCTVVYKVLTYSLRADGSGIGAEGRSEALFASHIFITRIELQELTKRLLDEEGIRDYKSNPDWQDLANGLKTDEDKFRTRYNSTADEYFEAIMNNPWWDDILVARGLKE